MRQWRRPEPVMVPADLVESVGHGRLAELLYRRGCTTASLARAFLDGTVDWDVPLLPDLDRAVAVLDSAVQGRQRICVYGDYDADGVTSTALLVSLLRYLGTDVLFHVPNRFRDGYGMHAAAVDALAAAGVSVILTCDCGIRNVAEVRRAREHGMAVVVTDHHELGPELPDANAVVNPKRLPTGHSHRMLPGVGVAFLLARALLQACGRSASEADRWLDLVAVGILADVVPLTGANRGFAQRGLSRLSTDPCPGLKALLGVCGIGGVVSEESIGFQIVPRLNAAGRMADAAVAVRLLLASGEAEAVDLANQLDQFNAERKKWTASVVEAALAEVQPNAGAIILYRPEWHEGVLGIAAGRLAEEFGVPALLMARRHGSGVVVGSARAPAGIALHEALEACREFLLQHGGHESAAGFSLYEDQFAGFRSAMLEEVRRRRRPVEAAPRTADLTVPLSEVDMALYEAMRQAAPFGEAHPEPTLCAEQVSILSCRPMGAGDRHLRLVLRDGEQSLVGIWWGAGSRRVESQVTDLFYRLGIHRANGEVTLQVVVEHVGPCIPDAPPPVSGRRELPNVIDRRGQAWEAVIREFPRALRWVEAARFPNLPTIDRLDLHRCDVLLILTPPPSAQLLDEALARTGAGQLVLAWPQQIAAADTFLPGLMRLLTRDLATTPYVSISRLATALGETEAAIRLALTVLQESDLLWVEEDDALDLVRLRRRQGGKGIRSGESLAQLRKLLRESRSYRRFLCGATVDAICQAMVR